jgi:hypothetical protein
MKEARRFVLEDRSPGSPSDFERREGRDPSLTRQRSFERGSVIRGCRMAGRVGDLLVACGARPGELPAHVSERCVGFP